MGRPLRELGKCRWLDSLCGICGLDPDEMLGFVAPKMVMINDRRLGILSYSMMLAILVYIIHDMFVNEAYLLIEKPEGTTRMNVMLPPFTTLPARACDDCPDSWPTALADMNLSTYCSTAPASDPDCPAVSAPCPTKNPDHGYEEGRRMPCLYLSNEQYTVPMIGRQLLVTTRVRRKLLELSCRKTFGDIEVPDIQCIKGRGKYLEGPPEKNETFNGYVAGSEDATVRMDHTMSAPERPIEKRLTEMVGNLWDCNGNKVRTFAKWNPAKTVLEDVVKNRIVPLHQLLSVAEIGTRDRRRCGLHLSEPSLIGLAPADLERCTNLLVESRQRWLDEGGGAAVPIAERYAHYENWMKQALPSFPVTDCGSTLRHDGVVIIVSIDYDNTKKNPFFEPKTMKDPEYSLTVKALNRASSGSLGRVGFSEDAGAGRELVKYEERRGVLIIVQQTGRIGSYDFKVMLINLTAGLGLLAVSTAITQILAKYVYPLVTGDVRYYELMVEMGPDFNEDADSAKYHVRARQSAMSGEFHAGDEGKAHIRSENGGVTKMEIQWYKDGFPSGATSMNIVWPNPDWFEVIGDSDSPHAPAGGAWPAGEADIKQAGLTAPLIQQQQHGAHAPAPPPAPAYAAPDPRRSAGSPDGHPLAPALRQGGGRGAACPMAAGAAMGPEPPPDAASPYYHAPGAPAAMGPPPSPQREQASVGRSYGRGDPAGIRVHATPVAPPRQRGVSPDAAPAGSPAYSSPKLQFNAGLP